MWWPSHAALRGVGADQPGGVGGVAGVDDDPRLGAALVARHVLDRGPADGQPVTENARSGRAGTSLPSVEDDTTGHGAGSVGHAEVSSAREVGVGSGWPGRGIAVPRPGTCVRWWPFRPGCRRRP